MEHTAIVRDSPEQDTGGNQNYWSGLIDEKGAADFLGVSPRTLQLWRQRGGGPQFIRLSIRCVRYRRSDLRDWADARVANSTAQYPT